VSYKHDIQQRLAFVQLDADSITALRSFKKELARVLPPVLDEFYAHISSWPQLAAMFKGQGRMEQAKKAQLNHWMRLFDGSFDDDYVRSVENIGLVHSRVGLDPSWYIGAYSFVLSRLYVYITTSYQPAFVRLFTCRKTARLLRAINQCALIDMDLAIGVYLKENTQNFEQSLREIANRFENQISSVVDGVSATSTELEMSAHNLTSMARQTSSAVDYVSQASEEAVKTSSNSVQIMLELQDTLDAISEFTDMIADVAEKTNLLALNATIEAARAGEAGKGFSVVASEVKSLATQTGQATDNIRVQVDQILAKSHEAVQSISSVQDTVNKMSGNGTLSTSGSSSTRSMSDINHAAHETGSASAQVHAAAAELAKQGTLLKETVRSFLDSLRGKTLS